MISSPIPRHICSNAGLLAFARTAANLAITGTIDNAFVGRQNPNLTHTFGSSMTSCALALILGSDDVSAINLRDPLMATGLITQVPSDSTIHRRHQELAELDGEIRASLTTAMKAIRAQAWNRLGPRNPAVSAAVYNPLVIDIDATEITVHSDKELASATWKKHFGFHPLCAFIDLGEDHGGEVRTPKLRAGKARANTVADHLDIFNAVLAALPDHADNKSWGRRLLIRSDAGGGTKGLIEHIESLGHGYLTGFRASDAIGIIASTTGKEAKSHILRPDGASARLPTGFIANITDRVRSWAPQRPPKIGINPGHYLAGMRVIMKAEHPASGAQLTITDVDGRRVRLFVTNLCGQP